MLKCDRLYDESDHINLLPLITARAKVNPAIEETETTNPTEFPSTKIHPFFICDSRYQLKCKPRRNKSRDLIV